MDPVFLTLDEVFAIHEDQIQRYGGSRGLRQLGVLSWALRAVSATLDGRLLHESLSELAAAYLFYLAQNHAFVDGNNGTAVATALAFLWMNDVEINAGEDVLADLVLSVARGRTTKAEIAVFLQSRARTSGG